MSDSTNPIAVARSLGIAVLATFAIAVAAPAAWCQSASPALAPKTVIIQVTPAPAVAPPASEPVMPAPALADQPAPPPAPHENPGLINEIGKMFSAPTWGLPPLPALPSLTLPSDPNEALPKLQTMVKGRMVCPVSANGAPDCKAGSDRLCQSKGFKEGKSLDTDSAQSCTRRSLMTGNRADDVCKTDNYVIRAMCQ